jgi:hypothetical protein
MTEPPPLFLYPSNYLAKTASNEQRSRKGTLADGQGGIRPKPAKLGDVPEIDGTSRLFHHRRYFGVVPGARRSDRYSRVAST